ncbi:MAG TPA: hypothetical protein VG869_05195 [Acidimicrobiia bacterium]|jgi:hypothetical protein|nr:hypothetical protein [Acidimicrobiia bacterium]
MDDHRYERPRVEDRTTVTEPLNTINTSHGLPETPAWRSRAAGDGPVAEAYEPPGVAGQTPVSDPLNAVSNSNPLTNTPAWRTTQPDDEPDR